MSEPPPDDGSPRRTSGARPGGRSERVVRDILEAAAFELGRSGYGKLGIDEIAARAGVAKTTIYRRWPTKAELVTAALRATRMGSEGDGAEETIEDAMLRAPDTGSVRADLLLLLRAKRAMTATPLGMSIVRMINTELENPEVEAIARELRSHWRAPLRTVIERGVERGELASGTDPAVVTEVLSGALVARTRMREPLDDAYLEKVVDLILNGAARR